MSAQRRKPREFFGRTVKSNFDRAALEARAKTLGENGLYRESEALARKIAANGPQWYFGRNSPRVSSSRSARDVGNVAVRRRLPGSRCPVCDSGSMTIRASGYTCKACGHVWPRKR